MLLNCIFYSKTSKEALEIGKKNTEIYQNLLIIK